MSKAKNKCPFWSPVAGNCKASAEGLFIPLDIHVTNFCTSAAYKQCPQFASVSRSRTIATTPVSDRRQHHRHTRSRDITIIRTNSYIEDTPTRLPATIIDFSQGGIRLLLKENLRKDSAVTCSLGNEFPKNLRSGPALIRWCEPLLDQDGYQAGLSFNDDRLPLVMNSYLSHF